MQVKQWDNGNVMIVFGSAQGGISRMRFKVPLAPGSAIADIQASLAFSLLQNTAQLQECKVHKHACIHVCRWLTWSQTLLRAA